MGHVAAETTPIVDVRTMDPDELAFVKDSWVKSYHAQRPRANRRVPASVRTGVWNRGHRKAVDAILATASVKVATSPSVPDEILGWSCIDARRGLIHYIYVKSHVRRWGVANVLMRRVEESLRPTFLKVRCSHMTPDGWRLVDEDWMVWDPWAAMEVCYAMGS